MFGSKILEVAIGMAFVYLLLSVLCSALKEGIAAGVGLRSKTLVAGIQDLLQDQNLANLLFAHPLIKRLSQSTGSSAAPPVPPAAAQRAHPEVTTSYIAPSTFAVALMHILAERGTAMANEPQVVQTQAA